MAESTLNVQNRPDQEAAKVEKVKVFYQVAANVPWISRCFFVVTVFESIYKRW